MASQAFLSDAGSIDDAQINARLCFAVNRARNFSTFAALGEGMPLVSSAPPMRW